MSFFSRLKSAVKKFFGGGSSDRGTTKRASRVSNYGGGGSRSYRENYSTGASRYQNREDEERRKRQEQKEKRQATTNALASISKRTDSLASGRSSSVASSATHATSGQGTARVIAKINEKGKTAPPDPKEKARQNVQKNATAKLKQISNDRKEFNKATGNKYNVDKNGTKARIAQKSQAYDVKAEKYVTEKHPIATSFGRGAVSGVTFGGSELLAKTSKNRRESGAEAHYQKNKNKYAEMGGEIAGSLVGFGLTEAGATKLAGKVAPKFVKEGGASVAKSLAKNSAFRTAAKKEAERTGIEVTEEVIDRFARQRAQRLVNSIGSDMAVNLTTGGAMDVNQSLRDSTDENGNVDWKKFRREMGTNAAINLGLGGAVTVAPALRTSKGIIRKGAREDALDLAKRMSEEGRLRDVMMDTFSGNAERAGKNAKALAEQGVKGTTDALSPINLSSKADKMTEMRQAMQATFARDADEARRVDMNEILAQNSPLRQTNEAAPWSLTDEELDEIVASSLTPEDFMRLGMDRQTAEILAGWNPSEAEEVAPAVAEVARNGIPKGNIKPLAESLRTNEFLTRSGKPQYVAPPRSVSRVDTSIDGLSKRLDDLRTQTPQTDRERRAIETKINDVEEILNRAKWRREGGADMEAMKKAYRGEYEGFDMGKYTNSYQGSVLEGKVKGKTATVVEMTPDEYIERTYRQIFKKPTERADAFLEVPQHREDIAKYAEAMRDGDKFPLPYLDYVAGQQEGRHRAFAAKEAGIDKIPVVIIDSESKPKAIIDEVSEATAKAADTNPQTIRDEAAQIVKEDFANATQPRPLEEDFPVEGTPEANEMLNRINEGKRRNAEAYANEQQALEGRVRELENEPPRIEGEEPLRYNNVAEDTPIGGQTIGERMAKSAYERNTGETLDEGIKSSWHDAWNASREYHASHATGRDVRASKTSVSQLNMMDSDAEREIRDKLFDEGWLDYTVVHTDEMLDRVSKEFRDDPKRWVDDMIDVNNGRKLDFRETPEWQARVHYIMAVVDPSADPASEIAYTEAYKLATQMSSKAGQTNNLRRQFVHLTPAGRRDAIMDEMAQILYNSQGFHNAHKDMPTDKYDALAYVKEFLEGDEEIEKRVKNLVKVGGLRRDAEYGIDAATESAAKTADDLASVADELPTGNAPKASKSKSDSDEIMEAHADLLAALNEKNPKSKLDVVQEIRYLNMLGNPKTHIRNIFGSGFFSPIRQISNSIRAGIERSPLVKNSGLEITPHGGLSPTALIEANRKNPTTEAGKKAKDAFERLKPELLGSMKLDNQLYSGRAKTLSGKMLDKVSDFNSTLLSKEDDYFKQKAFRENYIKSYEAYKKRGTPITKKIEKKIEAEAMQEAQIATFNEYNEFAKFLSRISKNANDPNASGLARTGGLTLNAVMPFTKVPANIMKQSVNYSPIGLVKGFSGMQSAIKKGDSEALNRAIDELASGTTGTGIFLAGMLLGKTTDRFTTNAGKDDAAAKFKKAQGMQNYSVTYTAPDGQNYSITLDWLVPNSATFFAGVELANQMKAGNFNALDLSGSWAQITSRIVEPVMETSMLSGLYSMLESTRNGYGDDDKQSALSIMLRETAQSYVNSLAPTMLGQAARTAYSSDLQVTGETDNEYFRNQLKSKLGLGETNILGEALGADTTAYGDVKGKKETTGDYVKSGLKNFLSPANIQKIDLDEMDQAKIKQYEDAVKNGADPQEMAYLFPKKQYKKQFTTGNLDVKLSNRDLSAYNQAKTTGGSEGARYALESIMFNRYTKDEEGKKHSTADAYTPEQKAAVIKQFEGKSIREVEKWVREQPQFKKATEAEQKKVIDGLWSYSKQGKAQSAKRVGEQAVIEAQGGDVNEYNFNNEITEKKREVLQPLVDSGVITYEEAVDFARFAGKTYYYEDDEGGHSQTYYNKGVMMDYLKSKGYSDEKCAALFNSFKAWNAKEYGKSSGRRRYGRRRRGYRRWHRRGGGSGKATVPTPKTIKASQFSKGEALVSKKRGSNTTNTNPKLERVKAKIDLPTPKR